MSVRVGMAFALIAVLASTGCGAADRAPAATATARAFQTALEGHDGRAACAKLSRSTASKLAQDQQKPCAQAILEQSLPTGTAVARARVYVTSAAAEVPGGDWMFLDEGPHGWEISAAGCKPTHGDMPLDCQVES